MCISACTACTPRVLCRSPSVPHFKGSLLTIASVSVSARWAWLAVTSRAASRTPSASTPPPRCTTTRLRAGAPCRRCCSCRGHRAWPRCWGTATRPVRRRAEEGTLVALLGFGWAVSASLRSALACWLSFSLASFYTCTAQEVLHLALPFLPDSAAGLWHDIVAGSQTMVVTGGWSGPFRHKVTEVLDSSCGTWRQPPQAEIGAQLPLVVCWLGVVVGAEGILCVCRREAAWGRYARALREEGERRDGQ